MAFWKESMINQLSNLINRNRLAAKISQVLCSNHHLTSNIWTNQSTMKLVVFGTGLLKLFLQSPHGMVKVMLRGASKIGQDILP